MIRAVGLILAGGEARRMGGIDKTLLELGGYPLIAWVLQAMALPSVAISANGNPDRFAAFNCPVLSDGALSGQGPLAGLLAGLEWAARSDADALITVPGDTPFLPTGLASQLLPPPKTAAIDGKRHHLVASWPVACRHALHGWLTEGKPRRVETFAQAVGMTYCSFPVQMADCFVNINTRADLAVAQRKVASKTIKNARFIEEWE